MLFSRSEEHALRALIYLAERGNGPLRTVEIAEALGVPRNYLSKLLHQLGRAGILDSGRGPRGGFTLSRDPASLSLREALRPIESERVGRRCLLGRADCSDDDPCPAHARWKGLREHITTFLDETTIADLSRREADGQDWTH